MKKIIFWAIAGWGLTILSAVTATAAPQRIISLAPSVTEQLRLLGDYDKIVGNTTYCLVPPGEKGKAKVGTITEINVEKIASLKPDLIITTRLSSEKGIRKLEGMGIRVEVFPQPKGFEEVCEQFMRLAEIMGKRDKGAKIVSKARREVEEVRRKVANLPTRPKVFIQLGAKPLFAATGESFVDDFIDFAGGVNIAGGGGLYSREEVVRQNPDIILIISMGIAGEEELKEWGRYITIEAVRKGRVHIVDAYRFCSPSPVTFPETLKEMVALLHPERGE